MNKKMLAAALLLSLPALAMQHGTAVIQTRSGAVPLTLEITQTDAERAQGLMFRTELPARHGMLFSFGGQRLVSMWMKNTLIPLDMVFLDGAGRVVSIHKNARPMDEKIISSGVPASGVIELSAGAADDLGIAVGDTVAITPQ